ncbi:MAG TPA: hypothetical protein VGX23_34555 [Actinocrinis sp.]|nr:hypothetical protein [Actinocrinis sp.]
MGDTGSTAAAVDTAAPPAELRGPDGFDGPYGPSGPGEPLGPDDGPGESDPDQPPAEPLPGDTVLSLYPLTYLDEADEVTVGCAQTESYVVLPADGAALLRRLGAGASLAEAAAWYLAEYHESVNIDEFVEALIELEFLRPPDRDGRPPAPGSAPAAARPVRWQRLGRAVFSPIGALGMIALLAAWAAAMVRSPGMVPENHDVFFTRYISIIELVTFLGQFPLLLIHESFHALAGRRLGLRSTLSIGRRLYYVVFLTNLDGLVTVPRRKRYLPMLAGMLADLLVIAVLGLIADATRLPGGALSLTGGICLALGYTTVLRLSWQFYFYLETDLYYVAVTVLGCVDLQKTARNVLRNRWNTLRRRPGALLDPADWHPRDREIARWYSWLVLGGWTFSLALLPIIMIPIAYRMLTTVGDRLVHPSAQTAAGLSDSIVFFALNLTQIVVIWWLVRRDRARTAAATRYQHVLN